MSKSIEKIKALAENLSQVRATISIHEEQTRQVLDGLKAQRDQIQDQLLAALKKDELTSIKSSTGDTCAIAKRTNIEITDELAARKWAKEVGCWTVDKRVAATMIGKLSEITAGFQKVETEYISVRHPKATAEV